MGPKSSLTILFAVVTLWLPARSHAAEWPSQEITLLEAIENISKQYEVYFTFDMTLVADVRVEYKHNAHSDAESAIEDILEGTSLKYQFYDQRFVIIYKEDTEGLESLRKMSRHLDGLISKSEETMVLTQGRNIRIVPALSSLSISKKLAPLAFNIEGIVEDQEGEPLIGVNIQVKGTNKGTSTDFEGKYSLEEIDENAILVVSYVGYQTQEVSVAGKSNLSITLISDSQLLDEVVVVGYGTQKKVNVTGAVSHVGAEVLENRPITNLAQGLQGVVPNLNITNSSGAPGADADFNIRGFTSLNGGSPLILINGVPGNINLLNPNDIKEISVLKDAASAAIYGARGAFGVILITTKNGVKNDKPVISFSSNFAVNKPTVFFETMDALERMNFMNAANMRQSGTPYFDEIEQAAITAHYNDPSQPSAYHHPDQLPHIWSFAANTNWSKEVMRTSYPMQQHNASISGGFGDFDYYTSISFLDQEGLPKYFDENYKRYNVSTNLNYKINDWLKLGSKILLNRSNKRFLPSANNNAFREDYNPTYIYSWPEWPVYLPDGRYAARGSVPNMVQLQKEGGYQTRGINDLWLTGSAIITPFDHFTINLDYTSNVSNTNELSYGKLLQGYNTEPGYAPVIYPGSNPSKVTKGNAEYKYNVFNAYANYENKIQNHTFNIMVGFNQEDATTTNFSASREQLIVQEIPFVSLAHGTRFVSDGQTEYAIRGVFSRINYDFDNRYLLEINGRYDGTSKFPTDDRFAFFPSVSLGWRIDNEPYLTDLNQLFDVLKLRFSYGNLGNQNIAQNYPYISTYNSGQVDYLLGGEKPLSVYAPGLVSPTLTWEVVRQINFGLDASILEGRLSGSFDFYRRNTENMLTASEPLPSVLAVSEPQTNAADLKTIGFEGVVDWKQFINNGSYSISFILSDYTSEITKYRNPRGLINNHYVGQSIGEIWGLVTNGLFQSDEEAKSLDQNQISGRDRLAGDIRFKDLDGDGIITRGDQTLDDHGDMKIIGNSTPRYSFGFRSSIDWKQFNFSLFFQGVMKRDVNINTRYFLDHYNSEWPVQPKIAADYWTEDNRDAYFPRPLLKDAADVRTTQTRFLQNGAYLRMKEVTLGYSLPNSLLSRVGIERLQVYLSGYNLFEFTKMLSIVDPELTGSQFYPINRSLSLGLNINL